MLNYVYSCRKSTVHCAIACNYNVRYEECPNVRNKPYIFLQVFVYSVYLQQYLNKETTQQVLYQLRNILKYIDPR